MEKELKTCTDTFEHGQFSQSANFCQKGWDGRALLGQPSKGRPCRISILYFIMFYYIFSTTYKKIGDLFSPHYISGLLHIVKNRDSKETD